MIVLLEYIDLFYDFQITIIKQGFKRKPENLENYHFYLENQHSVQHA